MALNLTDEQRELSGIAAEFFEKRSPEAEVRRLIDQGGAYDPAVWSQLTAQLGVAGLLVPEEYGGGGSGYLDFALVAEQAGVSLVIAPLLSSANAVNALVLSSSGDAKSDYLPKLASGELIGTLAVAEDQRGWDTAGTETTAVAGADGSMLITGVKTYVVDGQHADLFVVSATGHDGSVGLYAVEAGPKVAVTALDTLDLTRPQARVCFNAAPGRALTDAADTERVTRRVLATAAVMLAAEQVGGAQRCLDMAVAYAKVRVQFGRPIGSFQAIKHKCADMLLDVESARSAAYYAASVLDEGGEDPEVAAALAKAHCSVANTRVAGENIQIHGGIGFTWEHPAHLYYKRAKTSEFLYGDPAWHRERLADLVGI